jgi:Domain of unknown function (DUF4328)
MGHPGWPVGTRWVATPPPGVHRPRPQRRVRPYAGPPFYTVPPRWGFPPLTWRWPRSVPGTPSALPSATDRVRFLARHTTALLWLLAGLSLIAMGGEVWRYVLLLESRYGALSADVVAFSDALLTAAAVLALAVAVLAAVTTMWWLFVARDAAVELSGYEPSRSDRHALVGLLVPGLNLVVAGSLLAELEHAVLRRPVDHRPTPTRLVLSWWIAWGLSGVLATVTLLWRLRSGVQAKADGVVLTAATDLVAAIATILTVVVVCRLTALLAPIDPARVRMMRVIRVEGAEAPPLRPARPVGAVR